MTHRIHLFISVNFLLATASCYAMNENNNNIIKKPIFCFFPDNERVFIGGKEGMGIFDIKSKKVIPNGIEQLQSPQAQIHAYAAHKNSLVIVYNNLKQQANIFNMSEGRYTFNNCFQPHHPNNIIAINNNRIFSHDTTQLSSYDYSNKTLATVTVPYNNLATAYPRISCHPTKNEAMYPSDQNNLTIVQPGSNPVIKTVLYCAGGNGIRCGEYNPTGTVMALRSGGPSYYIWNHSNDEKSPAIELYIGYYDIDMAFHPHNCLLAILSCDNRVHYWNYTSLKLVATTHILSKNSQKNLTYKAHKRLAFSPDGMHLAVALKDEWCVLDVPQNNLFAIFAMLKENNLLQELIQLILQNIIVDGAALSHLNFAELSHIAPLPKPTPEQEDVPQQKTQYKTIRLMQHNEWKTNRSDQKQ